MAKRGQQVKKQKTVLLPPFTAVRMAWASTGKFTKEEHSQKLAVYTEQALKNLEELARNDPQEKEYIISAKATMDACWRSLDTIYKGRQLNFEENEKLMNEYSKSIKENLEFGKSAKDFIKSLPTMTISTAGGVTLAEALGLNGVSLWGLGIALAGLGYVVNLGIVKLMRRRTQNLYVKEDYYRDLYYAQYITRVETTLLSLYLDLDRIHENIFDMSYPVGRDVEEIIKDLLAGVKPTFCKYLQKHMNQERITPKLWSLCETGVQTAIENCPNWEG